VVHICKGRIESENLKLVKGVIDLNFHIFKMVVRLMLIFLIDFYNNVSNVLWEHVYKFEIILMNINDPNVILND
jgi:hypothetical protein